MQLLIAVTYALSSVTRNHPSRGVFPVIFHADNWVCRLFDDSKVMCLQQLYTVENSDTTPDLDLGLKSCPRDQLSTLRFFSQYFQAKVGIVLKYPTISVFPIHYS
jgi:hypothetical protein